MKGFGTTKALETKIDEFLDALSESNIYFKAGISQFLESGGASAAFQEKVKQVAKVEHRADDLRRHVEAEMYQQSLIPDFQADVLSLLEDLDHIVNIMEENIYAFAIENPQFPESLHKEIKALAEQVSLAVESGVVAARSFFRDIAVVRDHVQKVMVYEKEADKVAMSIKTQIFQSNLTLEQKTQLRTFVDKVDQLADEAEDVCDFLAIYTIKRVA